jgi:hypothetical protein
MAHFWLPPIIGLSVMLQTGFPFSMLMELQFLVGYLMDMVLVCGIASNLARIAQVVPRYVQYFVTTFFFSPFFSILYKMQRVIKTRTLKCNHLLPILNRSIVDGV